MVHMFLNIYLLDDDTETKIILDSAYFETTFSIKHLSFNKNSTKVGCIYLDESMSRNSI